jgi:hypothetical protein
VFFLDSLLVGGLRFVLDKVGTAVDAEMNDEGPLREMLLDAQMRLELGEIDDDEFAAVERDVLARLRELRGGHQGPISMGGRDTTVDVQAASELDEPGRR